MASGDLVCFSHLRWDFVYQRPQHLMTRAAREGRVLFIEERAAIASGPAHLTAYRTPEGVDVYRPVVPATVPADQADELERGLITDLLAREDLTRPIVWHYTPMAEHLSRHLDAGVVVYDCMDELAAFRYAPDGLRAAEARLLARADLVFTGGQSLYRAKQGKHRAVHAFPSGVDAAHFATAHAMRRLPPPSDLAVGRPIMMYVGVLDERIDIALLEALADARPEWSIVLLGPVVKMESSGLPQRANVRWLGMKAYGELPSYLAHADVGIMPFAINEATRYISPTKTPEYLAAGLPVVSTPILDVVQPYGNLGLVHVASDPAGFVAACESAMEAPPTPRAVEAVLARASWDSVWSGMSNLIREAMDAADSDVHDPSAAAAAGR